MDLGEKLKNIRESKGFTQIQAAKALEISNVVLNRYEKNERRPDAEMLKRIAEFYNISVDYILGLTSNPNESSITDLEEFIKNNDIKYCGEPVDKEDKENLLDFMKLAFKTIKNKK